MKIKILIDKDFLKFGITKLLEEDHEVHYAKNFREVKKSEYLVTDKFIDRDRTVIIYSSTEEALFSSAKIKITEDSTAFEFLEAIEALKDGQSYSAKEIKKSEEKVLKSKEYLQNLNARQKFLISEIISGSTNSEIAKKLYLSEGTVKNNLTDLYRKIDVKSRMELIKICKLVLT
ncbi:MAG: LuxR C-terminal-related transcriptional regulator [Peptoniphilus sp.]|nr:LuxR C-terminal-related transcriptional regulator [Peptoniphilus sp.]